MVCRDVLCGCQGLLGGVQAITIWLLRFHGWFGGHHFVVTRMLWVVYRVLI